MINQSRIAIIIVAYNEERLIVKTMQQVPSYIDIIISVNDGSTDKTLKEIEKYAKHDKRIVVVNKSNGGVGSAVKSGIEKLVGLNIHYIVIAPGDNQCDLSLIKYWTKALIDHKVDVVKGNRFLNYQALQTMPKHRLIGNSLYSFVMKFVSGYYSLFDFQVSFGVFSSAKLFQIPLENFRDDYLFDNSLWINLNRVKAKVIDMPSPAIYADEVSTINYRKFIAGSLPYLFQSFYRRILNSYILAFHPVGLFLLSGLTLMLFGIGWGSYVIYHSLGPPTASTATVMLSVVPFILGFQLLLQAIVLDIQNEPK